MKSSQKKTLLNLNGMSFKDKTEFKDDLKSRKKLHKANITKLEKKLMI